jgi:Tol biopolymer transport system component
MKRLLFAGVLLCLPFVVFAQTMNVHTTGGTTAYGIASIDSITFTTGYSTNNIVFTSNRDGNNEIYVMNTDGSGQTRLTNDAADDYAPRWSPDGSKIAFCSNRPGTHEVYIMDADGANVTKVTTNSGVDYISGTTWYPDGQHLAYSAKNNDVYNLYKIKIDGTGKDSVMYSTFDNHWPDLNQAGTKFTMLRCAPYNAYTSEIYTCNTDSSNMQQLTFTATGSYPPYNNSHSSWSPNSNKITFVSSRDYGDTPQQIYTMNSDSTNQINITNFSSGTYPNARCELPKYSPDGTKIIFNTDKDGNHEIYIMNSDGSSQTRITNNTSSDRMADWR